MLLDVSIKRHTDVLEKASSLKMAIEGVLLDEKMQARSLQFMRYVTVWLLRTVSQSDYKPDKPLRYALKQSVASCKTLLTFFRDRLPLPSRQPEAFSCLPEYALQNVVDNMKFVFR